MRDGAIFDGDVFTGGLPAGPTPGERSASKRPRRSKPYDFVVHVRNIPDIKYNPLVRQDRNRMALDLVRGQCPGGRVVGEDTVNTEIYGITSSLPDYVVLVSCARRR